MDVDVAGTPMRFKLEVMMFDILQTVTHFAIASANLL